MAVKAHIMVIPTTSESINSMQSSHIITKILLLKMFTMIAIHTFYIYLLQIPISKPLIHPAATQAEVENVQTHRVNDLVK